MKTIAASDFKARCLALLDEISDEGEELIILKRGVPVARVLPVVAAGGSPQAKLRGTVIATDDLIDPPLPSDAWEVEQAP